MCLITCSTNALSIVSIPIQMYNRECCEIEEEKTINKRVKYVNRDVIIHVDNKYS